jgi:hypothetical protein
MQPFVGRDRQAALPGNCNEAAAPLAPDRFRMFWKD